MKINGLLLLTAAVICSFGHLKSQTTENRAKVKTFTILNTNDLHSSFIGMGPSSDYTPFELNNDKTVGGYARLAGLIHQKKKLHKTQGALLILDAGDYSMGTPFGAATREIGGELQIMAKMGFDATTFGNHEFDLGPKGLGEEISVAARSGFVVPVLASNTDLGANDTTLVGLQKMAKDGFILPYKVIDRGGIRFGLFGLLGKEATFYTGGAGAVKFADAVETARKIVKVLRDSLKVDVVICLSHGGVEKDAVGKYTKGDDIHVAEAVPGIDIVIGGHSHTALKDAIVLKNHSIVVQTGKEGENLGELVVSFDGKTTNLVSWKLNPVNDAIKGDKDIADAINKLKPAATKAVFSSRGYSIDQPLAIVPKDLPNTFTDIAAGTFLANLVTDAFRQATHADIGLTANGMMRAGLKRGKTGIQTVYDLFAVAPLGSGIVDPTAGSALVTAYFTGKEIKNILEFIIIDNPAHPGEFFPRSSGMKFTYNTSRSKFDAITAIEIGDYDHGYKSIDISGKDEKLYSLTTPIYLGMIIAAIPKYSKDQLPLVPKNAKGEPLKTKVEALEMPKDNAAEMLAPKGIEMDRVETALATNQMTEIKEWQAIMDYLCKLPVKKGAKLPVVPVDKRAAEVRAIKQN
ncbi:MAG: bifunctional UDP-sugar hydrolase/5'-nucleotidase [Bacteroidota bacterium]